MPPLPQLSEEQRKEALEKAKQVRVARGALLEEVRTGKRTVASVVEAGKGGDQVAGKLKVVTLVRALPGFGKVSAEKLMAELEIVEGRRVGGLGANQAARLVERLDKPQ